MTATNRIRARVIAGVQLPRAIVLVAALGLLVTRNARAQGAQSPAESSSLAMRVDSLFREVDSAATPGCVAGIARAGSPLLLRSYGSSDLERGTMNDTATIFEAGSVSKQFTAAAIVLLAQEGKLSLDDSVRRWIPELSRSAGAFTIRQMLHHESGLRDYGNIVELTGWPRGSRAYSINDIVPVLARQRALNFVPGSEYSYSNSNFVLAAVIVSRASGETFERYTERALFAPLGMTHTSWRGDYTRLVPRRASAWIRDDSTHWHLDMPFENVIGHAGLLTTVPDLLRWQENFRHPTVGGDALVRDMQTDAVLSDGSNAEYGLGLALETIQGARAVTHSGATAGYRAYVGRFPDDGVAVALLCNNGTVNTRDLGRALLLSAAPHSLNASPSIELGAKSTDSSTVALTGMYRNRRTREPSRIQLFANGLTIDGFSKYRRVGDRRYVSADGARTIDFEVDHAGKPVRYRAQPAKGASIYFDRVAAWKPNAKSLGELSGIYTSDEAAATWELHVRSDTLGVTIRPGTFEAMQPLYRDAFEVPAEGWLVTIRRGASGAIIGLDVGSSRVRTMPFVRQRGTAANHGR